MFRGLVTAGGVLAGFMGLFMAFSTVYEAVKGEVREAFGLVGITTLSFGFAVASTRLGSQRLRPRVKVDRGGTTFRPDGMADIPLGIAFLGLLLNTVNNIAAPHDGWSRWLSVVVMLGGALTAVFLAVLLLGYVRWGASSYLRLTPTGVEMGEGFKSRNCRWDEIRCVGAATAPGQWIDSVVLTVSEPTPLRVTITRYVKNRSALRGLVDFYWRYPQARGELTDGSAKARLGIR